MENDHGMKYWRFFAMIGVSTAAMFGLMYLNNFSWDHVLFSETRFWMAFVMGACMAVIRRRRAVRGAAGTLVARCGPRTRIPGVLPMRTGGKVNEKGVNLWRWACL